MIDSKRWLLAIGMLAASVVIVSPIVAKPAVAATASSAPIAECQLQEARTTKMQPNNVGFPHSSDIIPNLGKHKVILIPIDFPDAPGTSDFLAQQNALMKTYSAWYKFFSNGRASAEVVTSKKWFRAPKPSSSYVVAQNQPNTKNKSGNAMDLIAQDFINATGKTFDFTDSPAVLFIYPKVNKIGIETSLNGRGVDLQTPQGTKSLFYFGPGKSSYKVESRLRKPYSSFWGLWIHEVLHSQGMALHAPGNGFPTGLGQDQEGASLTIGMWEQFLLGWLKDSQVYCAPATSLTSTTVVLNPLEVASSKFKTAIVPLNKTQALVVESRRPVAYSSGWDKVDSGVFVYLVDTTKDNDRSGESNSSDRGNDMAFSKWAYYLAPDGSQMKNSGNFYYQYRDYFLKSGQSVTYGGVKITVVKSGSTDTVKLEKVAG
jgi:hypothetical protein